MRPPQRVVLDTNVLVSRLLRFDSVPGQAVRKALHSGVVLVSGETMTELADVLAQSKFDRYVTIEQRLQFIRLISQTAEFMPIIHSIRECRDPKDDRFLEVALSGRADVILTGDGDLLRMNPWREIEILAPGDYLGR